MSSNQTSNDLAALLVARVPAWVQVDHLNYLTSPPIDTAETLELLGGSPRTHIWHSTVRMRDRRTGWVYIAVVDSTDTYTLTIDAVGYAYPAIAGDSRADILDGLLAVIVAAAPAGWAAVAVKSGDGSSDTVALMIESTPSGDSSAPSTFAADSCGTGAAGRMHLHAEVSDFDYEVWQTAVQGINDARPDDGHWFKILDGFSGDLPEAVILPTAAGERIAVIVNDFNPTVGDGNTALFIFPAFYVYVGLGSDETVVAS